eukprot:symbB.v1.2.016398.t1/scaffold1247.1/size129121/6
MQRCVEEALTEATASQLASALRSCADLAANCVEASLTGDDVLNVASVAQTCGLRAGTNEGDAVTALWSQLWAFLGWYNAVQLVIIPWVCLWMFSSSVLGLARFARFQYQLLRISIDTVLLMVLSILIQIEDCFTLCTQCLHSGLSKSVRKCFRLERDLKKATTFAEYRQAEEALQAFHSKGRTICRRPSGQRLACSCEEHLQILHLELEKSLEAKGTEDLAKLEPLLVDQAGGVEWSRVPNAEQYLEKLCHCLEALCQRRKDETTAATALHDWLVDRRKAIGRTALCLSGGGSLAMHHMGVCRFLLEEGLMPKIVSGVSGGSIVAGFLAIHTDEEILKHVFVPEIPHRHAPHRWFPHWWQELFNFLHLGVLVPTEDFENTSQAFFGHWTFEEAFRRTGRPVTIVISSNFSRKLPACVMLNHMTAPRVTIASAVAASCAAIGVMRPRGLVVKDPVTGTLAPFNVLGESFADGSFTAEVPKDYLRSCFGATRFLVSQVNPHVSSFMDAKGGVLHSLRGHFGFDLQQRARMLSEYNLLPSFFGRAMCQATKHLSQDFQENKSGLTVHPPSVGLASVKAAISNPTTRDMERYILQGQRMAWEKAHEIRIMMLLEAAVTRCLERLEHQIPLPYCHLQPPPEPNAKVDAVDVKNERAAGS